MKKIFVMLALALGVTSAFAQNESDTVSAEKNNVTLAKDVYPQQEDGDLYHGLTRKLTFDSTKPDGTMRKLTDPSKLHQLGWHHKIEIEEGVRRMYEWYLFS
jgi:nucleoside-diphosphate-sugar epimerase